MMGVDYELFWTLNPKSLSPFIKAFSLSEERVDRMAWINGAYIRMAVGSLLSKNNKYPDQPLFGVKEISEEMRQARIKEKMFMQMELLNSRFRKEELNSE